MGKGGYGLTYQEVYEMENLTIEAKAIYGMLCSYAGSKAMAYPSVDFICDKLKISRTRFYKHMNLLVGAGVVKKEQRKNENQSFSGNVYVLVPNLQNIQMPCTENEYAGNASTGNEETNINTFNINTLKSKTEYREVMEAFNAIIEDITSCTWNKKCHYKSYRRIHWCRGIIWSNFYDRYGFR